jgi:hypothetical protein
MSKSRARDKLDAEIAKQAGRGGAPNKDSRVTFGWFVRNRWYPLKEANWKPETARDKKCIIQKDLLDPFESIPLEDFDKFELQVHLNNLAKTRSKDRVLQIKAYMQGIFAEAADQEFLAKDPARNVKAPENLRDTDKTTLSGEQLRAALSKLSMKERLILELDMTKQECPNSSPEAFIFAKNKKGEFMDSGNFRRRVLHRLAEELKLPELTFQVIRRTIATLAQKKGGVKDVQGMLRSKP